MVSSRFILAVEANESKTIFETLVTNVKCLVRQGICSKGQVLRSATVEHRRR